MILKECDSLATVGKSRHCNCTHNLMLKHSCCVLVQHDQTPYSLPFSSGDRDKETIRVFELRHTHAETEIHMPKEVLKC